MTDAELLAAFEAGRLDRAREAGVDESWDRFAAAHPDLLAWQPSILDRYYSPGTLSSARARRVFVMPDRVEPPSA